MKLSRFKVKLLRPDATLPHFATHGAAGADVYACMDEPIKLHFGEFAKIPTGIALEIPWGFHAQIRPRSGLAAKHGVTVLNAPGTIDSDYRGEVSVLLINHHKIEPYTVKPGERIAQMVCMPHLGHILNSDLVFQEVEELGETERGDGGFGSTGAM